MYIDAALTDAVDHRYQMSVQMTCVSNRIITSLVAGWPGSVHDSRVFSESSLCHRLQRGMATVHYMLLCVTICASIRIKFIAK